MEPARRVQGGWDRAQHGFRHERSGGKRVMSHPAKPSEWWNEGVADVCTNFQMDLSCLVDGELDEAAAGRVMLHLEECDVCRDFFEDTRDCLRLHFDVADPDRLLARVST